MVNGRDHLGHLVHKCDGTRDVVQHWHLAHLLPGHRDVLQQLHHRMRDILESAQMHTLLGTELAIAHVAVVLDDLAHMLGRQLLLAGVDKRRLATTLAILAALTLFPLARLGCQLVWRERARTGRRTRGRRAASGRHARRHAHESGRRCTRHSHDNQRKRWASVLYCPGLVAPVALWRQTKKPRWRRDRDTHSIDD